MRRWPIVLTLAIGIGAGGPGCVLSPREDPEWGRLAHDSDGIRYAYAMERFEAGSKPTLWLLVPGLVGSVIGLIGSMGWSEDDATHHTYGWMTLVGFAVTVPCLHGLAANRDAASLWWLEAGRLGRVELWPGSPRPWSAAPAEPVRPPGATEPR